jgi:adenylate cyclase
MPFRKFIRLPVRLPEHHPLQQLLAAGVIGVSCALLGVLLSAPWKPLAPVRRLDDLFYDALYRLRPIEDKSAAGVLIVAVDDQAIEVVDAWRKFGWPWPREFYGHMARYLDAAGARAIVFDLLFDRPSVYNGATDDDNVFAEAMNGIKTPTVFATQAKPDGSVWELAPPIKQRTLAAANISPEDVVRTYDLSARGHATMAPTAVRTAGAQRPPWAKEGGAFLLHYYGPHAERKTNTPATFRYVSAAKLLFAALDPAAAQKFGISPDLFRGKIVLIGTITAATYDLKSSPVSAKYPGVEIHATAIQNLLEGRRVIPVAPAARILLLIASCLVAAFGAVIPARVPWKLVGGALGALLILGLCAALFTGRTIHWLPPAAAMIAAVAAAFVGVGYSYFTEVRQRQAIFEALSQSTSREVADQIRRDPRLAKKIGGDKRDMTVMFTDLAGFTTLCEELDGEVVANMLNLYLEEMSEVVFRKNGTLDKYIGDAIMSFWNAPLNQADHATRACNAAIEMQKREAALQPRLLEMSGHELHSRIGINSGPMTVGNMGSTYKFAYTVLGDSVNLASRLEGANKMYGTRVLLSETTANLVKDQFTLRKVDLLRVKGKTRPMAVYELIGEGPPDAKTAELIKRYEAAFTTYQSKRFDQAYEMLLALAQEFPADGPTAALLARALQFQRHPPEDNWDGVWVAVDK